MRKFLSVLLSAVMVLGLIPATVLAADVATTDIYFTVSYYENNIDAQAFEVSTYDYEVGVDTVTISLLSEYTTADGEEVTSWTVGTGTTVYALGSDYVVTADTSVYAVCDDAELYTVTFDANDGTGEMDAVTVVAGDYTLPECEFTAPDGYEFDGWDLGAVGDTYEVTENVIITAQWVEITVVPDPTYTVSFDAGEGTGTMADVTEISGDYILPECEFTAPDGYEFDGWDLGAVGTTITVDADVTLVAQWTKDSSGDDSEVTPVTYTVKFDANDGEGTMDSYTADEGEEYTLPENAFTAPSGKTFNGWTIADETYAAGDVYTVNCDTTVIAIWKTKTTSSGSSSSGSSSSSGGTTTTVTGTVEASATATTVDGVASAEIDHSDLLDLVETAIANGSSASEAPHLILNLTQPTDATSFLVGLSAEALSNLGAQAGMFSLITDMGSISLDADSLMAATAGYAEGATATLSMAQATADHMNETQLAVAGDRPVYEIKMTVGDQAITSFGGGFATISLPYTLGDGENANFLQVRKIHDNGMLSIRSTSMDSDAGKLSFQTPGLSIYYIAYDESVSVFEDVDADTWYADAVLWAVLNGVTEGTDSTSFSPVDVCTRGQIVTFLYRAAGEPEVTDENPFTDVDADAYYYDAVLWAVAEGITTGTTETTFSPAAGCTRGQVVTFLYRAAGEPEVTADSSFGDVDDDTYYATAVIWAVENGITNGTGDDTFSPEDVCTRAQIVTFLYRYMD